MGTKLSNAPVYFTLAQVRFNPILNLDPYVAAFQDSLRKEGFPDFKKNVLTAFSLQLFPASDGQQQPPQTEVQYIFTSMDNTSGFILGKDQLAFQSTSYDVFKTFADKLLNGLKLLHHAVGLMFSERIGVRYLDAIYPRSGETLDQYLLAEVLGLSGKPLGRLIHSYSESRVQTEKGVVVSRAVIQDGGIAFPPDLNPLVLKVADRFLALQGRHAILDTDAFIEARESFDLEKIKSRLDDLHIELGKMFETIVSAHALSVWK